MAVILPVAKPPFRPGVKRIVFRCSKEQVLGVHTWRVVAVVADEEAVGNCSVVELPTDPMGMHKRPFLPSQFPVPVLVTAPNPLPASIGNPDVTKKPVHWVGWHQMPLW